MAGMLFVATIGAIWVVAMIYPIYRRHAAILRRSEADQRRRRAIEEGGGFMLASTADALLDAVRHQQGELFRQGGSW
jgi:hypothetical protein